MSFNNWLASVGRHYMQLTDDQRNATLDHIIQSSEASQLYYLYNQLNSLLKRDFLLHLPQELSFKLLFYLDAQSLLTCCQVSKEWNSIICRCTERWRHLCLSNGVVSVQKTAKLQNQSQDIDYKSLWQHSMIITKRLQDGDALQSVRLFGHTDRVMAVSYHDGWLATGSDDHCVRIWDCASAMCIKILQTHTVADLRFDRDLLLTGSFDTTAASWDMNSGQLLKRFEGHVAAVFSVDYNQKRDLVVTGSADSTVRIWCLSSGVIFKVLSQHRSAWITQVRLCVEDSLDSQYPSNHGYSVLSRDNTSVHMWTLECVDERHEICHHQELASPQGDLISGIQLEKSVVSYAGIDRGSGKCTIVETYIGSDLESGFGNTLTCDQRKLSECKGNDGSDCGDIKSVERPSHQVGQTSCVQGFLGSGLQFDVYLVEQDGRCPVLDIVRHSKQEKIASVDLPGDYRPSKRGSTTALGERTWLNGFDGQNDSGVFFACSLKDNSVLLMKWMDKNED